MDSTDYIWEYTCMYKYFTHIRKSDKEGSHEFEGELGGIYGRVWRKKGKGEM